MTEISAISLLYQKPAPEVTATLVDSSSSPLVTNHEFSLQHHLINEGKWILLFFNPSPSSVEDINDNWELFKRYSSLFASYSTAIFACAYGLNSLPSSHPPLNLPVLLDDESHRIGKAFEVLILNHGQGEEQCTGDYARAIFLISPQGIIRHISLYDEVVGSHEVEELLSLLKGFQTIDESSNTHTNNGIKSNNSNNLQNIGGSVLSNIVDQLRGLSQSYSQALIERPILTKSITSALISVIGELIGSLIHNRRHSNASQRQNGRTAWEIAHRVIVFGIYGLSFTGPFFHWWYRYLHQLVTSWSLSPQLTVVLKVLLNQLVMTPPFLLFTIGYLQYFLTFDRKRTIQTLKNSFVSALFVNWKVWTVAQTLNFGFVPMNYQVLFGNLVALWWNIYLSLISSS